MFLLFPLVVLVLTIVFDLCIMKYLVLLVFQSRQVPFYFNRPPRCSQLDLQGKRNEMSFVRRIRDGDDIFNEFFTNEISLALRLL